MRLLRDVKAITKGLETQTLRAQFADTNKSPLLLFSLIFEDRSIDFQSYGEKEYEAWINGLRHAVAYSKLSPSSHPYTMRAKMLNPALNAEMKYNSDEAAANFGEVYVMTERAITVFTHKSSGCCLFISLITTSRIIMGRFP